MFITLFYGVVDRSSGQLRYANMGHPHAFIVGGNGDIQRLSALDPPLGMVDEPPHAAARPWACGRGSARVVH